VNVAVLRPRRRAVPCAGTGLPSLPEPPGLPVLGHLPHWANNPLQLLIDGASAGPVFRLRLWRPAIVGYQPEWNRTVLSNLDIFRSRGSLSGLTPYLSAGIVQTDTPHHRPRRHALNKHFSARALAGLSESLAAVAESHQPSETVDATAWSAETVQDMLNMALFGGTLPRPLLKQFLQPLHRDLPVPMLPRPRLFHRIDQAIAQALASPPPGSIAACLAPATGAAHRNTPAPRGENRQAVSDLRVALAAGYDTTSHTLAWAAWHLAARPEWQQPHMVPLFLDEILRRYPAGWLGSRITSQDTEAAGVPIQAGTLVLYSPYLTHHDPTVWKDPHLIRPERFESGHRSWAYLPFAAGPRTCLGAHLSRLILLTALQSLCQRNLAQVGGNPKVAAGLTLRPGGPLLIHISSAGSTSIAG
jgi:cytochrome P450